MSSYLEVHAPAGREVVLLATERVSIGSASSNDLVVEGDRKVSRLHAVVEPYAGGWGVRDIGSRNGTYLNGERLLAERALHPGDEVRVGGTRIVFKSTAGLEAPTTETAEAPPDLTRREREVLIELCRPVLAQDLFTEPATVKDIAGRLVVTEAAVKHHLANLYDKFGILEGERRRVRLANDAIRRGAVTIADLR